MRDLKNQSLNALLIILVISVLVVSAIRFLPLKGGKGNTESFQIANPAAIKIQDINGTFLSFTNLLSKDGVTYVLVFDSNDCPSCIFYGLEDLKRLKKEGRETIALMIHDSVAEARNFSFVNEFEQLMILSKVTFYEQFQCALTPVIVKFKKGACSGYRYIKP